MTQGRVEELPDEYDDDLNEANRAGQHAGVSEHKSYPPSLTTRW
jgi:hypothetical protein